MIRPLNFVVATVVLCASMPIDLGGSAALQKLVAAEIIEITLEQRCFGCEDEGAVTLRRDGTATKTTFGNARQGTQDLVSRGTIAAAEFTSLAALVVAEGFDGFQDDYRAPRVVDGAFRTTTVVAGERRKTVTDREGAPAGLARIQARIRAIAASIVWRGAIGPSAPRSNGLRRAGGDT